MYPDANKFVSANNLFFHKKVVHIPKSVIVNIQDNCIFVSGRLGKLQFIFCKSIHVVLNSMCNVDVYTKDFYNKALIGTTVALIKNMIIGVTLGFVKKLQLVGIGYRVQIIKENVVNLSVGLSHSVNYVVPLGIEAQCLSNTEMLLRGIDKQLVGQVAANLRAIKPPEPFKGKGIRYENEIVHNKDTKKR